MSLKVGDEGEGPLNKKQKSGDDAMDWGGPMDDEETARKKLEEEDFDPDASVDDYGDGGNSRYTPLILFCRDGDIKMVRHLLSKGASTTKRSSDGYWCPMYAAASGGNLDLCKLLFCNGAGQDIRDANDSGWSPVTRAANKGNDKLVQWLVLHGALSAGSNTDLIAGDRIYLKRAHLGHSVQEEKQYARTHFSSMLSAFERLVEWAEGVTQTHGSLVMFLLGTLAPKSLDAKQHSVLQSLDGYPGVRKHIGDFVLEVTSAKHLKILYQVKDVLPSFIQEEH